MPFILAKTNSVASQFLAELRDVEDQKDRARFRRNMVRLGEIFAYELSKSLRFEKNEVETPLGVSEVWLPADRLVLATILRAGLPLHQGLLNYFDAADNAFISAYRMHHKDGTFEIALDYASCPPIDGAVLVLADPMLATGASIVVALKELARFGEPREIHVVAAIASRQGVEHVRRNFPKVKLWLGDIDEELTAKSYIVPGLGDAGDLAFGEKN